MKTTARRAGAECFLALHHGPIDGLFQAGPTTYPGTSMLSGIFAAEALMKRAGK